MALVSKGKSNHVKEARLEARVTKDQKRLIERAARLNGTSVTDFLVASAQKAAADTVRDFEILTLSREDQERFVKAILNPPQPNDALKAGAARHKLLVRN